MSNAKKSWFEKAISNFAAQGGVNPDRLREIISDADFDTSEVTFSQLADQVITALSAELNVPAEMAAGMSQLSAQVIGRLANGAGDLIAPADRLDQARSVLDGTLRGAFMSLKNGGKITPVASALAKAEATSGLCEAIMHKVCEKHGVSGSEADELIKVVTEPSTAVEPVMDTQRPASNQAVTTAVKKAAKKNKPLKALSDMEELKAKLAA